MASRWGFLLIGGVMHNGLFQRPQEHEARSWIDRIGAQRHAVENERPSSQSEF